MKVTTISYEMKRSNGNYGSDGVSLTAELNGESPEAMLNVLEVLADFQLNGERRGAEAAKQIDLLGNPASTSEAKERANRYLEKYEKWMEKVAAAQVFID